LPTLPIGGQPPVVAVRVRSTGGDGPGTPRISGDRPIGVVVRIRTAEHRPNKDRTASFPGMKTTPAALDAVAEIVAECRIGKRNDALCPSALIPRSFTRATMAKRLDYRIEAPLGEQVRRVP
jgi:hypothetical protein